MERPKKYTIELAPPLIDGGISMVKRTLEYYQPTDIDPLLDELEMYRNTVELTHLGNDNVQIKTGRIEVYEDKKPFPSYEEFSKWLFTLFQPDNIDMEEVYDYFAQFQYERTVYPKVGDMVAGKPLGLEIYLRGKLEAFYIEGSDKQCYYLGNIVPVTSPTREEVVAKVESKLNNDELTFDRELVEQFLRILRGDK